MLLPDARPYKTLISLIFRTLHKILKNFFIRLTVWSATRLVFGAGKSDLIVGTPYARQPTSEIKSFYII